MHQAVSKLFLPGFGARARSYDEGLPRGWQSLQPPPPAATGGTLPALVDWLADELRRRPAPALLAGHSMGAALAILLAARDPRRTAGLILIGPAGLPLTKPVRTSAADLTRQIIRRDHRVGGLVASGLELVAAPRSTVRLIRALRRLDLRDEMARVRRNGIPVSVIGCDTDTLTPPEYCRSAAGLLGGRYRELRLDGGHVWMFGRWPILKATLEDTA